MSDLVLRARTAAEKVYGTQFFNEEIEAAIALVLEEAAKAVEGLPVFTFHERNPMTKGEYTTTHTCAAAIRALAQKDTP